MKRSLDTAFQKIIQIVRNFFGIGPTTAQAAQAQNQLAIPSTSYTLTDGALLASMLSHGYFNMPFEIIPQIIQTFPTIESLNLRAVSKPFCLAWEKAAKNQLFITQPAIHHLGLEQVCNTLHEQQRAEIKYLCENKTEILKNNKNDSRLIIAFNKLISLENNDSMVAYHAKEQSLNSLNETIIRNKIVEAQQMEFPVLIFLRCHLTRFPGGIFSDALLGTFWKKVRLLEISFNKITALPNEIGQCAALKELYLYNNQLTALPDTIGQCTALKKLMILQNKLTTLPNGLRDDITFLNELYQRINKAQCLALQKIAIIKNKEETQAHSTMRSGTRRLR